MIQFTRFKFAALILCGLLQSRVGSVMLLTTMEGVPNMERIHTATTPVVDHALETLLVLAANVANPSIRRVRVLLDASPSNTSRHELNAGLRSAVWAAQEHFKAISTASRFELDRKLSCEPFGQQPTYADMLRYANAQWPSGSLVAVANADVLLLGADLIDQKSFAATPISSNITSSGMHIVKPLVLVLSVSLPPSNSLVRDGSSRTCGTDQCHSVDKGWSWDVHVFATPLAPTVNFSLLEAVEPQPVYMNAMGAENRVGWMLHQAGYELRNPCIDIRAEHWHCAAKTHAKPISTEHRYQSNIHGDTSIYAGLRTSDAGRKSSRGRGQAAKGRVDALLVNAREAAEIEERLRLAGYRDTTQKTASTRFFWVPRAESGDGRGVRSFDRSNGLDKSIVNQNVDASTSIASASSSVLRRNVKTTNITESALHKRLVRQQEIGGGAANGVLSRRQIARQQRNKRRGISGG